MKDGIYEAPIGTMDREAAYALNNSARMEEPSWWLVKGYSRETMIHARVYWKGDPDYQKNNYNKAVGYYFYSLPPENGKSFPVLGQIYVIPSERRKGYATSMFRDFLTLLPADKYPQLALDMPNEAIIRLLEKMREVDSSYNLSVGRFRAIYSSSNPFAGRLRAILR